MKTLFLILISGLAAAIPNQAVAQGLKPDSAMKENILGLRTCIYKVPGLDAAKKWYADAFDTAPYFDESFYVGFNIGGYELGLMPAEGKSETVAENVLTYWGVDNVQEVFDAFIELGATVHEAPHNVGGPLVVASVKDPWGNVIGFIYNPVFKPE